VGGGKVGMGEKKVVEEKSRANGELLCLPLTFLQSAHFFSAFPTFPHPTICPWLSKDAEN